MISAKSEKKIKRMETRDQSEVVSRISFKMSSIYGADREKIVAFISENKGNCSAIENFIDEFKKGG